MSPARSNLVAGGFYIMVTAETPEADILELSFDVYLQKAAGGVQYSMTAREEQDTDWAWAIETNDIQDLAEVPFMIGMMELIRLPPDEIETFHARMLGLVPLMHASRLDTWAINTIRSLYIHNNRFHNEWSNINMENPLPYMGDKLKAWAWNRVDMLLRTSNPRPVLDLHELRHELNGMSSTLRMDAKMEM